jgi:hypothetical protein
MVTRFFTLLLFCVLCSGCSGQKLHIEDNPELGIIRFDTELYQYLTNGEPDNYLEKDIAFLNVFGEKVLGIGATDSLGFYDRLKKHFSEPTLMGLYRDVQEKFADTEELNKELSQGMSLLLAQFRQLKQPRIYMHVSGLNQNVIVTDDILSLSADKYMGADYPLYKNFFYDYQLQLMVPTRMAPDYLLGFMMANFPFKGNDDVLLDKILYEGKLRYLLSQFLPDRNEWECVGYSEEEYAWCNKNRSRIWKTILENQHLFTANYLTTSQYLKEAPHTAFLPVESPGRVGIWLGYNIICSYMKQRPDTSLQELIDFTDYRELLKQSKYRP